jgi:hypothetical protein
MHYFACVNIMPSGQKIQNQMALSADFVIDTMSNNVCGVIQFVILLFF